jgi:hypothetical protein
MNCIVRKRTPKASRKIETKITVRFLGNRDARRGRRSDPRAPHQQNRYEAPSKSPESLSGRDDEIPTNALS